MKKLFQILGTLFIVGGIIFLLVHSFVVTGTSSEDFARDIFGLPIPHPPVWTSYVPFLGYPLGLLFEFFSLHGLIGAAVSGVLLYIGGLLITSGDKEKRV